MIIQLLVAGVSGALAYFSFYIGLKIVKKYFKGLENSRWKNFVAFSIGSVIVMAVLFLVISIFT